MDGDAKSKEFERLRASRKYTEAVHRWYDENPPKLKHILGFPECPYTLEMFIEEEKKDITK